MFRKRLLPLTLCLLLLAACLVGCQKSESSVSLQEPLPKLSLGMSRAQLADVLGKTESELLNTSKSTVSADYQELHMEKPVFLGVDLYRLAGEGQGYAPIQILFADDGTVCAVQATVTAKDAQALEKILDKQFGSSKESHTTATEKVWYDKNSDQPPYVYYLALDTAQAAADTPCFTLVVSL